MNTQKLMVTEPTNDMIAEWADLLRSLIPDIHDEYRCSEDPYDETPGMLVTFGFTPETEDRDASWSYQTGDNSFYGSAYGQTFWGLAYLYRDSDPESLAADAANEIAEQCSEAL